MRLYFPGAGTLGYVVWPGAGISCSPGIPDVGPPVQPTAASLPPDYVLSTLAPRLCHPTHLDECSFFKSLVVRLPCDSGSSGYVLFCG